MASGGAILKLVASVPKPYKRQAISQKLYDYKN